MQSELRFFLSFLLIAVLTTIATQATAAGPERAALVPRPAKVDWQKGNADFDLAARILYADEAAKGEAKMLASYLAPLTAQPMPALGGKLGNAIVLTIDPSLETALGKEGYRLEVLPTPIARITAAATAGLFYGGQTLRQMCYAAPVKTSKSRAEIRIRCPAAGSKTSRGFPGGGCCWTKGGTSSARNSSNITSTCWPITR